MPTKKCVTCSTEYEYETLEELLKFFYKKDDWIRNTCKKCECEQHKQKYADGKYNYSQKKKSDNYKEYLIGTF